MRTQIYCDTTPGSLLAAVQSANLFPDCKHFVDMPLRFDASITLQAWRELVAQTGGSIQRDVLLAFLNQYFEDPGCELEEYQPEDHAEQEFDFISDPHYRLFAKELHLFWPKLSRRVNQKVQQNPEQYSLLSLPNPFIVPGGRFRELYYWDSFWTIKGLLSSKMFTTVRGMIDNMCHLIDVYGFIPNGNRIYYLNRSQPPLLTWCVEAYFAATQDLAYVAKVLPFLEREMDYFMKNKLVNQPGWKSHLFQFRVVATGPRPESYREDVEAAEHIEDLLQKQRIFGDIAAGAESGRDFSARWFGDGPQAGKMGSIRTSSILPVELNAIICGNLRIFSQFYTLLGQAEKAQIAFGQYQLMREAIHQVFWNEAHGCWFDYDLEKKQQTELFFDTNLFPLFCKCEHEGLDGSRIVNYLSHTGILNYNGIPTSLITSGQQWDFPSGWAPMNWMVIIGLKSIGQVEIAKTLAAKWIAKNYLIYLSSGKRMYEKYNVADECFKARGGGGEYELQEGFGWTNGVILDLLNEFRNDLVFDTQSQVNVKCECCRAKPAEAPTTPPQESIVSQLTLPVDVERPVLAEEQKTALAAVLAAELMAAELANNTPPNAVIGNDGPLIRAA